MAGAKSSEDVEFQVLFRARKFGVKLPLDSSLADLSLELSALTGALPETQRILVPGKHSSPAIHLADSTRLLRDAPISDGAVVRLLGATSEDVKSVTPPDNLRIIGFDEELKRARLRRTKKRHDDDGSPIVLPPGPYTFMSYKTLEIPGRQLSPPASSALRLLHRLSSDPGIVAVMNKHKWQVLLLSEMLPEGFVGVSPVCLLGVNKNFGEEISIRLRTDDFKGFRKYDTIKETLLHELTHMVHGDHDIHFKTLLSQITKEAHSSDWTKSYSHRLIDAPREAAYGSGSPYWDEDENDDEDDVMILTKKSSGMKLGRGPRNENHDEGKDKYQSFLPPNLAAAESAIKRLNEMQMEMSKKEGNAFSSGEKEMVGVEEKKEKDEELSESTKGVSEGSKFSEGYRTIDEEMIPADDDENKEDLKEEENHDLRDTEQEKLKESESGYSSEHNRGPEVERNTTLDANIENNNDVQGHMDEEMEADLSLLQDSSSLLQRNVSSFLAKLQNEVENERNLTLTISSLLKIMGNVIQNPNEAKFRQLRMDNPSFFQRVGRYSAALDLLKAVGFQERVEGERKLILKEIDIARLWLSSSILKTTYAL